MSQTSITLTDLFLLAPELSLAGLGIFIILLNLVTKKTGIVNLVAVVGIAVPLTFSIAVLNHLNAEPADQLTGMFGTMVIDHFSLFFKFLVLAIVALIALSSSEHVANMKQFQGEYYSLIMFSASGMMLIASATELISIYVSLELTALPVAALAAFSRNAVSTEAGIKFLILSAMSSAILLYGMALVFGFTGTTYLPEIFSSISSSFEPNVPFGSHALFLGVILIIAGFGFKIAAVPFQMWVPDVYEGSPTPITAYLSVASKAAGFAIVLRVSYLAFGSLSLDWAAVFTILSFASMTIGNVLAVAQDNIKRMLAYSTIAHAGYIMIGLAAISERVPDGSDTIGPSAILFYLVAYAVTNLAAFFAIIAITSRTGSDLISSLTGVGRRSPILALTLTLAIISLIGIPPTAGFMGKLYLFSAAIKSELVWLVVAGVINSTLSAYYYLRVVKVMYVSQAGSEDAAPITIAKAPLLALSITSIGTLALGIFPGPLINIAEKAASVLLG